ncbi:uncharacterized protein LOC111694881 [Eurytemora carolleeae]|uniref:uncharacterized protein LOC111694881 n=1 Tax=Eurytemora carolleeae TaxID=1294199 RepID=UPI000C77E825|nr:uncharacterized protein LOC111694881 [Eurytemora carolleeae]|eukprot:XP_023319702.1 uncharacterized protein LOC111694881 [Eurytemora affinis]
MAWHKGEWWPLYVPEWYSPRVSQYFFDPYSFTHILHGVFFYGLLGWWPQLIWGNSWWWVWLAGPGVSFLLELAHEFLENSDRVIQMYRTKSGTSGLYQGDSIQNIIGDLVSCTFGWYLSALCVHFGVWWLILVWTIVSELALVFYMRDSLFLILFQLTFNIQAIKTWQAEKVPAHGKPQTNQDEIDALKSHPS